MRGTAVSVVATATTNNITKIIFDFFKWHRSVWQLRSMYYFWTLLAINYVPYFTMTRLHYDP